MVGLRINPVDNKSNKKSDRMGNTHMYNSPRAGSVCELALGGHDENVCSENRCFQRNGGFCSIF